MPRKKKETAAEEPSAKEQDETEEPEKKTGKGKRGPAKKYTPEALRAKIDEFLADCDKKGVPPLLPRMLLYLNIGRSAMYNWCDKDTEEGRAYLAAFEYAQLHRESYLLERMVSDNKLAQGCLNALKQAENGGYVDRPQDSGEVKITINVAGCGGEAAAK